MILETTYKAQPIPLRTRQHRIMAHRLLRDLSMVSHGSDIILRRNRSSDVIRIAIYDEGGVGSRGPGALEEHLIDKAISWAAGK